MDSTVEITEQFFQERQKLFSNSKLLENSYKFCVAHSLLVEEYIIKLIQPLNYDFVLTAVGGFSRRELSPYSDIDLMFIFPSSGDHNDAIEECVRTLWDAGIEVSHTVREISDISKFLREDLHAFTQFFETRFILGNIKAYHEWNSKLFEAIEKSNKQNLIFQYFDDTNSRHIKYGNSSKVLEPNVKFTAGGLRDIHAVEWMYSIKNQKILSTQDEITQTEVFFKELLDNGMINRKAYKRLYESYKTILRARNFLHVVEGRKNDRLEFSQQEEIAMKLGYTEDNWKEFMYDYFHASTIQNRFSKTMMKRYKQEFSTQISDYLSIDLDDDFEVKGEILSFKGDRILNISDIMRGFYYRCMNDARFENNLRSLIIESIHLIEETNPIEATSSVFFRELLKLPSNVGKTLLAMNEFGFLDILLPEFKNLNGFFQPGVYHCYTADEHTLIALQNLENLYDQDNHLARLFKSLPSKDILYLAVLLHDIGKPISVSGHEIIGAEVANTIMQNLGYGQSEIDHVQFLIRNHLVMEQIAFRRDLNDPATLDDFISIFPSMRALDHLYLLTFADLSAVNTQVWTQWKAELLLDLYAKSRDMLQDQVSGEQLISNRTDDHIADHKLSDDDSFTDHFEQMNDQSYLMHYSKDEINQHINEIEKGSKLAVFFKENENFTNITVLTKDTDYLLTNICGVFAVNTLNIHDAKIFTRKDGIVIDSFNVLDFITNEHVTEKKYKNIKEDLSKALEGKMKIEKEFEKVKSKWKRLNKKLKVNEVIKIDFEDHNKFNIIDVHAKDKMGLLYVITHKLAELGLMINLAKVLTRVDEVVDAFYVLKNNGEKLRQNEYEYIRTELINQIKEL